MRRLRQARTQPGGMNDFALQFSIKAPVASCELPQQTARDVDDGREVSLAARQKGVRRERNFNLPAPCCATADANSPLQNVMSPRILVRI
jgi:hypothetical protein